MIRYILLGAMLLLALPAFNQNVVAYREAPLQGSNSYFLNGTAVIEELDNGTLRFRLSSGYSTNNGPDVQIFLTNNSNFSTPVNTSGALFVEDVGNQGGISHFSGAYSKNLPGLNSLSEFDHVVFVCVQFGDLHWGNGSFGTLMTNCTATSSTLNVSSCGTYTAPSGATFTASGTYQDIIPNADGCDSVITLNLTVGEVDASASNTGAVLSANTPNATYQWIDCNNGNAPISGATSQSFAPSADGSYAVIVTDGMCSDTSACLSFALTGIDENDLGEGFSLYPNPAVDRAVLQLDGAKEPVDIDVYSATGVMVRQWTRVNGSELQMDLTDMDAGVYFLRVRNDSGQKVMRLLKQR